MKYAGWWFVGSAMTIEAGSNAASDATAHTLRNIRSECGTKRGNDLRNLAMSSRSSLERVAGGLQSRVRMLESLMLRPKNLLCWTAVRHRACPPCQLCHGQPLPPAPWLAS